MHNSHGRKPLYEVIREAQTKSARDKSVEPLHPEPAPQTPLQTAAPVEAEPAPQRTVLRWPTKPKMLQVIGGRIELSLPYHLAIAAVLCTIILLLIFFRLGQHSPIQKSVKAAQPLFEKPKAAAKPAAAKPVVIVAPQMPPQSAKSVVITEAASSAATSKGTNRIVIQTHQSSRELEPVQDFFAQNGIETEIRKIGGWYYLLTKEKYENPEKAGTDGFVAKQRIIALGVKYQPPPGYGSFGAKPFSDAYGMRLD